MLAITACIPLIRILFSCSKLHGRNTTVLCICLGSKNSILSTQSAKCLRRGNRAHLNHCVAHLFRIAGNFMYITKVHYCAFVPWKNLWIFHSCRAICPFVHEMSAPLCGIINVTLYVSMGHSSKDVTIEFIIMEVLFIECFSPFQLILLFNNFN